MSANFILGASGLHLLSIVAIYQVVDWSFFVLYLMLFAVFASAIVFFLIYKQYYSETSDYDTRCNIVCNYALNMAFVFLACILLTHKTNIVDVLYDLKIIEKLIILFWIGSYFVLSFFMGYKTIHTLFKEPVGHEETFCEEIEQTIDEQKDDVVYEPIEQQNGHCSGYAINYAINKN